MRKLSRNLDKRKWNMIFRTRIWRSWLAVSKAYEVVWQSAVVLIGPPNWNLIPQTKTSFSFKFPVWDVTHFHKPIKPAKNGGAAQESLRCFTRFDEQGWTNLGFLGWSSEAQWKTKAHLWKPRLGEGGVSRWQLWTSRIFLWFHQLRCCSWQCTRII